MNEKICLLSFDLNVRYHDIIWSKFYQNFNNVSSILIFSVMITILKNNWKIYKQNENDIV